MENEFTKMDGKSKDVVAERLAQLKALIPEAFTEGKIDFDALKGALGEAVDSTKNHYSFTWNKKEEYRAFALRPSMGTLRPCVAESSGKDGTPGKFDSENLYIEGDNLEVLKLLQGSYYGKVKMIYIDPPYNTGKDFVYEDDFHDSVGNYKAITGQTDSEGRSTRTHTETSGRFHTDWLNMIFPRLLVAWHLLAKDGIVMIHIDENEIDNLGNVCKEVFGETNFLGTIVWDKRNPKGETVGVAQQHEYITCYAKDKVLVGAKDFFYRRKEHAELMLSKAQSIIKKFGGVNEQSRNAYQEWLKSNKNEFSGGEVAYCFIDERGEVYQSVSMAAPDKPETRSHRPLKHPITGNDCPVPEKGWRFPDESMDELIRKGEVIFGDDDSVQPRRKYLLKDNVWEQVPSLLYFGGADDAMGLPFDNPKPVKIAKQLIESVCKNDDEIILDFFSGSGTAAHATLALNAADGKKRKFIMVQLPELTYEIKDGQKKALKGSKAAFEAGYENICEIGKERIRRAGAKIKAEIEAKIAAKEGELKLGSEADADAPASLPDIGFKVFKLDTSNLIPWNPNPEDLEKSLLAAVDNAVEGRTMDDILYEVLLKCNLPLTLPIVKEPFGENTINVIGEGALMICLDKKIPATVAEEMIRLRDEKYKPVVPMQVVFLDSGFTDKDKANAIVTLKQAGVEEKAIMSI